MSSPARPPIARPPLARPTLARPTLARPTLAALAITLAALTGCADDATPDDDPVDAVGRDMRAATPDAYIPDARPDVEPEPDFAPDLAVDAGCAPAPERCDGLDDDCDGVVDEDPTGDGEACAVEQPGVCAIGARACRDGAWVCEQRFFATEELCDEADNDCDGAVDERVGGEACDTGVPGICATGVRRCTAGQLTCVASFEAGTQRCTGRDEDCDGAIDEDDGEGNPCVGCIDDMPDVETGPQCGGGQQPGQSALGVCTDGPELHVIGHYEPTGARTPVRITRAGVPLVLVLSSYEPTTWALELGDRVELAQVIVNGYEASAVEGLPEGLVAVDRTRPGNYIAACAFEWPADDGGCDTPGLVRGAELLTGVPLTSFQGCYSGAAFAIGTRPR